MRTLIEAKSSCIAALSLYKNAAVLNSRAALQLVTSLKSTRLKARRFYKGSLRRFRFYELAA